MKKIKFITNIIALFFVLTFLPHSFVGAEEEPFIMGDGSSGDPFQIQNCEQLQYISHYDEELSSYPYLSDSYFFILMNDIDCSDTINWNSGEGFMPIGNGGNTFIGTLLGERHIISDLYINIPDDFAGLFGRIANSQIDNLGLENVNIQGSGYVGGLVGHTNDSHIENIYTTGVVSGTDNYVGGLVGFLVGQVGYYPDTVVNSYSTCDVSGNEYVGGLIGLNNSDMVYNSFAVGDIEGNSINSGGLIGGLVFDTEFGDTIDDYIFNSGWFTRDGFKGIGVINDIDSIGDELSYNEIDNTVFYLNSHQLYNQELDNPWDFEKIWIETGNDYPKFISEEDEEEQVEQNDNSERRSRSSGTSLISRYNNLISMGKFYDAGELLKQYSSILRPSTIIPVVSENNQNFIINQSIYRILRYGSMGEDVRILQKYLNNYGYECGLEDGKFGQKTKQAVIKFQISNGLFGDGIVGPLTRVKLE